MRPLRTTCFLGLLASIAYAQQPSAASVRYAEYRVQLTIPSYGLAKVRAVIHHLKADEEGSLRLPAKSFHALSIQEKFTYTMIHGEQYNQICDAMPVIVDEDKKIFGELPPTPFAGETDWSDQQNAFLAANRPQVIKLLRATMKTHPHVGLNLKHAITEIDARELIPDLIQAFKREPKDHDLLTVLLILMNDAKFKPFTSSITGKKLYGPNSNFQSFVVDNPANEKLTIDRALAYYGSPK